MNGFPTIYFFRKDGQVIEYDGAREVDGFMEFLAKRATVAPAGASAAGAADDDEL